MDTPTPDVLPSSPREWRKEAGKSGLTGGTIFDLDKYKSTPNINYKQFLHLRVLWTTASQQVFAENAPSWIAEEYHQRAKDSLNGLEEWKHYMESCNKPTKRLRKGEFLNLGIFSHARLYQLEVERCEREEPTPKFSPIANRTIVAPPPPADGEQIVKLALVFFLNSVILPFVGMADFDLHWKVFQIGNSDEENKEGFVARVDGFFRHPSNNAVMAILDINACMRGEREPDIQMQEAAQMAAWISSFPQSSESAQDTPIELAEAHSNKCFTRLLISQDMDEVYLTFATFNQAYIKYITGKESVEVEPSEESNGDPFLRMNQFGPFDTNIGSHMRCLGYSILAFTLQHCN